MRNEEIRRAYDSVLPDAEAKERMLRNILMAASNAPPEGNVVRMKKRNIKKGAILILAAALALALSFAALAYATDLFGFRALLRTESTEVPWAPDLNYQIAISQPQDVPDKIDPAIEDKLERNRQAMEEWENRGIIPGSIENVGFESEYDFHYNIRSMEEEALLEEIAEKYGLKLRKNPMLMWSSETTGMTGEGFYTNAEMADTVSGACCSGTLFYGLPVGFDKVYYYDEGTFCVSWLAELPSNGEEYVCYGYNSMYGTLSSGDEVLSYQKEIDSFSERTHTAPDGTELTILSNGNEAYIYAYLENSFFTEHIEPWTRDNELRAELVLTYTDLDYIADCINYSVIGK